MANRHLCALMTAALLIATASFPSALANLRLKRIVGGDPADPPIPPSEYFKNSSQTSTTAATTTTLSPPPEIEPSALDIKPPSKAVVTGTKTISQKDAYLGIQYATAPVGLRRFQRPTRLKLSGKIDATKYRSPCPQMAVNSTTVVGDENCLFLNIFTPSGAINYGPKLPVLFWIHGGHFKSGSGNQYDPSRLLDDIIVVTIQYRLGSLGFLSLNMEELPGNQGMFDCAAALKWTHKYIGYFGGDPKRITVGGQGSGGSIATFLAINKHYQKYVAGVLAMSGTALSPFSVDKNETDTATSVAESSGSTCIPGSTDLDKKNYVDCMQKLSVEQILNGDFQVAKDKRKKMGLAGVASCLVPAVSEDKVDDDRFLTHFLQGSPMSLAKQGKLPKGIPMLTGVTKQETGGAIKGPFFNSLKKLPEELLGNNLYKNLLQANTGIFPGKTADPKLTSLFSNSGYINYFVTLLNQAKDKLTQLIKATTDAFFNLPVFLMSHLWSDKSTLYLYSFEQGSRHSSAQDFLPDLSLAGQNIPKTEPQHGDDLMYIFFPQTIFGEPVPYNELQGDEALVSQYMINTVTSFVKTGKPVIKEGVNWSPFSSTKNNYMIISANPREANNFHKCNMGLWSADKSTLTSNECSKLLPGVGDVISSIPGTESLLKTTSSGVNQLQKGVESVSKPLTEFAKPITNPIGGLTKQTTSQLGGLGGMLTQAKPKAFFSFRTFG